MFEDITTVDIGLTTPLEIVHSPLNKSMITLLNPPLVSGSSRPSGMLIIENN